MERLEFHNYYASIENMIERHRSFEICGIPVSDMLKVSEVLEKAIERRYFKCRIYTKNRLVTGMAGLLNPAYGIFSLAAIAAHNIVTYDPDYEIARDIANNRIEVVYKK